MSSNRLLVTFTRILGVLMVLFFSSVAAQPATTLSIAVSGEPWKDPSISQVGTKLSLAQPPSTGVFGLGWSSTVAGAMGVNWQVKKAGAVVASGTASLTSAAAPNTMMWIFIPSSFVASKPPESPVDYDITVTSYDATHQPLGVASAPVVVTQTAQQGNPTGPIFGRNTIFPSVKLDRYQQDFGQVPNTQVQYARAHVKITIFNNGSKPTDKVFLNIMDDNVMMRQPIPITIDSIAPGAGPKVITITMSAVLPPAQSQLPQGQQFSQWYKDYAARGVDLRVAMDFGGAKSNAPLNDHTDVALYKGTTDSCADGKQDGDETPVADCGGSCDCCFGKNVATSWWRDVYGFDFVNNPAFLSLSGKYGLGDVQSVFGTCSIYIGCPVLYIPDPFAAAYLIAVKVAIDGGGRCFGFSLAALSFLHGDESLSSYPMGGPGCDTWHLASPVDQNSPDLATLIKHKHMYQMTNEVWSEFLETRAAAAPDYWLQQLKSNLPAMLSLCDHAVVVVGVSDTNTGFALNLYDPNVPFEAEELTQPILHTQRLGFSSIQVSGGHYTFNDQSGVSCEGTAADDLTAYSYSSLQDPSMPSDPSSLIAVGSATNGAIFNQVSDAAGHKLFLQDGSINRDPSVRMRVYPFHPIDGAREGPVRMIVADAAQVFTHTVVPSAGYEVVFLGPNYLVHIDQASGVASETDDITIDPRAGSFGIVTKAAAKRLRAELTVRAPDKSVHRVVAQLNLSANKKIELGFDAQRETLSYRHAGATADLTLALWSSQNPDVTVTGKPVSVDDGDVISIKPDWATIGKSGPIALSQTKSAGTTRQLQFR